VDVDDIMAEGYIEGRAIVAQVRGHPGSERRRATGGSRWSGGVAPRRWCPRGKRLESL